MQPSSPIALYRLSHSIAAICTLNTRNNPSQLVFNIPSHITHGECMFVMTAQQSHMQTASS
jgi:hypothetical protein